MATIRVLLVDDECLVRQVLTRMLTAYPNMEVVGEAATGDEAISSVERLQPHIVVMDIRMPRMDGIEATQQIKASQPTTVVIGLSVNQSADTERKMKAAGASAYLTKERAVEALCHAIEQALSSKQHQASGPID